MTLKYSDITKENVDAIVNAANSDLAHGEGVAGDLNRASHGELQRHSNQYVRHHGRLPVGAACVTQGGGSLKCRYVVHTVGPQASSSLSDDEVTRLIKSAVTNSLREAQKLKAISVAFPAITTGSSGIRCTLAAEAIFNAILKYKHSMYSRVISDVRIIIPDKPTYTCFRRVLLQKRAELRRIKGLTTPKTTGMCYTITSCCYGDY